MAGRLRTSRITEGLDRLDPAEVDDRRLRGRILSRIRQAVPADCYAFLMTDPETCVGSSPVAEVPDLGALPTIIRLKYLTAVNRWTSMPSDGVRSLAEATGADLGQSPLWRGALDDLGVVDVLSAVFADRFGCWGFLDLWRRAPAGAFASDEVAALADAVPTITALLRGAQASCFTTTDSRYDGTAAESPPSPPSMAGERGPGVLLLSPELAMRARTPQTDAWLPALIPAEAGAMAIPASAYNVAAQLQAVEAGVDGHPPRSRVHLGQGRWLTLRADRLAGPQPAGERDIAVTMETSSPAERLDLFARAHGLTQRERELLAHVADGQDTRTVALAMGIRELTVQDHLKSVFAKSSVSSRRELLARAVGS